MTDAEISLVRDFFSLIEKVMIGVAAIVGSVLVQREVNKWSREHDKEKLLQEKAETLIVEILKLESVINRMRNEIMAGRKLDLNDDPLLQATALFTLYFPTLEDERDTLGRSIQRMMEFLGSPKVHKDQQGWLDLYEEHLAASRECAEAIARRVAKV